MGPELRQDRKPAVREINQEAAISSKNEQSTKPGCPSLYEGSVSHFTDSRTGNRPRSPLDCKGEEEAGDGPHTPGSERS